MSPFPSKTSTTGYTDQIVDQEMVLVRLARIKFWLNSFAQHAVPPHSASDHQSSDAQTALPAAISPGPEPFRWSAEQG